MSAQQTTVNFKELTTYNFKTLPDGKKIEFSKKTIIEGANGAGKTSIQQAIMACFTGLNSEGKNSLDEYKRDIDKDLIIESILNIENGKNIQKCAVKIEAKERNKLFYFNNKKIAHNALLKKFNIKSPKIFLASISPMFTMMLPSKEFVEILTEGNSDRLDLAKKYLNKEEISKINLGNIEESLKKIRSERLEKQKDIAKMENEISFLNGQIDALKSINPNDIKFNQKDFQEIEKSLQASKKIEEIKTEIEKKLTAFNDEINKVNNSFQDEQLIEDTASKLSELQQQEKLIASKISRLNINRPLMPPEYEKKLKEWELSIKQKNEYEKILSANKVKQGEYIAIIGKYNPDYEKSMELKKEQIEINRSSYLIQKAQDIQKLEQITKGITYKDLQEKYFILNNAKKSKETLKSSKPINEKIKRLSQSLNKEKTAYSSMSDLEKKIKNLPKMELDSRAKEINNLFPNGAKIKIEAMNDTIKITKNGIDFNWLSTSEKSKIMGVISNYITIKSGLPFRSMFIDNAEIFSSNIKEISDQTIIAKVSDSKLKINGKEL